MAVFSTNQNRHLYVANAYAASISEGSAVGTIGGVKCTKDGEIRFAYKGADTVIPSDLIQIKNITSVKAIEAKDLITPLKSVEVTLDPTINEGKPVVGQDYILRIELNQWIAPGDQNKYYKDGAVRVTTGMTAQQFYEAMAKSLNLCFSREIGATKDANPYLEFKATATNLTITEKPQPYRRGIQAQEPVMFEVYPTSIYVDEVDTIWGTTKNVTPKKAEATVGTNAIGNGVKIADLEFFCMGERGDQYRMVGFPNYIPTEYLVDPSKQYNVLEIHHAFTDDGISSYRSEKDITIVSTDKAVITSLIKAINTAAGTNFADFSGAAPTAEAEGALGKD